MEIIKLKVLEHSGQGKDALHTKVINEFTKSEENGKLYRAQRNWNVAISDILLTVASNTKPQFKMVALIKK